MKITIKNRRLQEIFENLKALDGQNPGSPNFQPYTFEDARTRYWIAANMRKMVDAAEALDIAVQGVRKELQIPLGTTKLDGELAEQYRSRTDQLLDTGVEFDLFQIPYDFLRAEANKIPGSVIGALLGVVILPPGEKPPQDKENT
jgi:hypothetical protein